MPVGTFSRETELDPEFVTGFCEAAASLTFSRSGKQLSLYFAVKLPARDRALLERLRDFFAGAGTLYDQASGSAAYYRIARLRELEAVVGHFDAHPFQGHKGEVFRVWREMVLYKVQTRRRPDREPLDRLAARLSATVRGADSGEEGTPPDERLDGIAPLSDPEDG